MKPDDDKTRTHVVLTQGTAVGRYRIVEKIGAGGMGEVYLAEDNELNRHVALKFLPQDLCGDEDCRARFKREAQAAARLNHPNIMTVYEVGEYKTRPYFSMEYVDGRALKDFISDGPVSVDFALDIAIQVCEGLGKAHREGVIHRDIKPSNIVIDSERRARIVDFGLASVTRDEKLTRTGSTLGTIGYMSPEQVRGKDIDKRTDLFSLGVVIFELLTGKRPFERENEVAVMNAILNDKPEPLSRIAPDIPGDLEKIVLRLLEKDPAYRYQNAESVVSELKMIAESGVVETAGPVDWWNRYVVVGAVVILAVITVLWALGELKIFSDGKSPKTQKKMLAVLPFENLGLPEDEYFADGITDEITSRLAMVHGFGVISRTSAYTYKNSDKTLPQIAEELGVDYVLEGTISWDKTGDTSIVRIIPQLIQVSDDVHMWVDNYREPITRIFDVQIDIATRIVEALDVTLAAGERQLIDRKPTDNLEAYDYYLQGREYWDRRKIDLAISLLEQAVESDPTYAKAYSLLARIHGFSYFNIIDRTEQRRQKCETAAKNAVRFSDGGIEGDVAMGYFHYYVEKDFDQALKEFQSVLKRQPSNSDVLMAAGFVQRRQGRWHEAADNFGKALEIDPHAQGWAMDLAVTLRCMREYEETIRVLDKSLSLAPDAADFLFFKAYAMLELGEDTAKVQEILDRAARYGDPDLVAFWMEEFDVLSRDYESAVNRRTEPGDFILADSIEFFLGKADIYHYWGRDSLSVIYYDSARLVAERRLQINPGVAFYNACLGIAYAGLGRKSDAIREGKKGVESLSASQDALYGPGMMQALADIYVMTGEYEPAIDMLDSLMSIPAGLGLYDLRHHPKWDPLRDHPRFQELVKKYEQEYGN